MNMDFIGTGLVQGCILAFVAYAVMIPFRLLDQPDLTADGGYALGGTLCAYVLVHQGQPNIAHL